MRTALPLWPSLQSLPPCTGASELHLHPARAIGSRVTTRSCVVCARTRKWFGDLSATTRRLALRREVRARPAPREGTRPFLARSGKSLSSPAAHASLPLPLPPYPVLACDTLRPRPATVFHARRRAYPPCHSMHDHRWGQRCSCDCGFGLTSRPLACSCTLPGAILEPFGEWAQIRALSTPTADDLCS